MRFLAADAINPRVDEAVRVIDAQPVVLAEELAHARHQRPRRAVVLRGSSTG